MENAFHTIEISFGIIVFCVGIYTMLLIGKLLNEEYESFSTTIYENHMIRRD